MKKLIILTAVVLFAGCATTSSRRMPVCVPSDFIELDEFCAAHGVQYSYDTIDDVVRISSNYKEMKLLLNSSVYSFDGNELQLQKVAFYKNGKIYIPREIEQIMFRKESGSLPESFLIKTIVLDPGHGGKDPGTTSQRGFQEKDLNLSVAKHVEKELKSKGFNVLLTRTTDKFLTLQQRVDFAKSHNADLFIAIHGNASRQRFMKGVEIYYLAPARLDSQKRSLRLAHDGSAWHRSIPYDAKAILWDLLLTKNYSCSVDTASVFYSTFKNLEFTVKSPRQAPFYVLRNAYVPSILVEVGYLSNRYEEKMLTREYYQQQIAEAISLGVVSINKRYCPSLVFKD